MPVIITDQAVDEVKRIMESQKVEPNTFLRMGVAGGGCSGLAYTLGFDTDYDAALDTRYERNGVAVVTRKKMALHLDGTTIDFQDSPMGRGFTIDNPTYPRGGGCPGCGGH